MKYYHFRIHGGSNSIGILRFLMDDACMDFKQAKAFRDSTPTPFLYPQATCKDWMGLIRDGRSAEYGFQDYSGQNDGLRKAAHQAKLNKFGIHYTLVETEHESEREREIREYKERAVAAHQWYDKQTPGVKEMVDLLVQENIAIA